MEPTHLLKVEVNWSYNACTSSFNFAKHLFFIFFFSFFTYFQLTLNYYFFQILDFHYHLYLFIEIIWFYIYKRENFTRILLERRSEKTVYKGRSRNVLKKPVYSFATLSPFLKLKTRKKVQIGFQFIEMSLTNDIPLTLGNSWFSKQRLRAQISLKLICNGWTAIKIIIKCFFYGLTYAS